MCCSTLMPTPPHRAPAVAAPQPEHTACACAPPLPRHRCHLLLPSVRLPPHTPLPPPSARPLTGQIPAHCTALGSRDGQRQLRTSPGRLWQRCERSRGQRQVRLLAVPMRSAPATSVIAESPPAWLAGVAAAAAAQRRLPWPPPARHWRASGLAAPLRSPHALPAAHLSALLAAPRAPALPCPPSIVLHTPRTAVHLAARSGDRECLEIMLDAIDDPDTKTASINAVSGLMMHTCLLIYLRPCPPLVGRRTKRQQKPATDAPFWTQSTATDSRCCCPGCCALHRSPHRYLLTCPRRTTMASRPCICRSSSRRKTTTTRPLTSSCPWAAVTTSRRPPCASIWKRR